MRRGRKRNATDIWRAGRSQTAVSTSNGLGQAIANGAIAPPGVWGTTAVIDINGFFRQ